MKNSLPMTWVESDIGSCFIEITNGTTLNQNKNRKGIPVSRIETIQNSRFNTNRVQHIDKSLLTIEQIEKYRYKVGDIAFSHINSLEHVGKTAIYDGTPEVFIHGMNLLRLRLGHYYINSKFAYYQMQCNSFREEVRKRVGRAVNQVSINQKNLSAVPFIIAPIAEQTRIVEKLDALLVKVNRSKACLDKIPAILKNFRQSVLAAAVSGDLTKGWREKNTFSAKELYESIKLQHSLNGGHKKGNASEPTDDVHNLESKDIPESWVIAELRDLCVPSRPITYGILKPGPEIENGIPYLRVADFPNDRIRFNDIKKTSAIIDEQFKRSKLLKGDLLLSIRGTVGRICEIPESLEGANITQDSARLSIQPSLNSRYILYYLKSPSAQSRMSNAIKGVAIRGINIGDVRALQVALPPIEEQNEIVRKVEELFHYADSLENRYRKAKEWHDKIPQAILAKAFRGELVEQDENEEPASVLLEKIKQENTALSIQSRKPGNRKRTKSVSV